jgi:hypothetical protein
MGNRSKFFGNYELGFAGAFFSVVCFCLAVLIAIGAMVSIPRVAGLLHDYIGPKAQAQLIYCYVILIGAVAVGIAQLGLRLRAPNVVKILETDPRAPVLYLRSFSDDKLGAEETLAGCLKQLGPVIAIGKPGERIPRLGAARLQVGPKDWQDEVHRLMERAQLIVFRAGMTDGLLWEFGEASKLVKSKPLLICAPIPHPGDVTNKEQQYQRFKRALANSFPAAAAAMPFELADAQYYLFDNAGYLVEYRCSSKAFHWGILDRLQPGLGTKAAKEDSKRSRFYTAAWTFAAIGLVAYILFAVK